MAHTYSVCCYCFRLQRCTSQSRNSLCLLVPALQVDNASLLDLVPCAPSKLELATVCDRLTLCAGGYAVGLSELFAFGLYNGLVRQMLATPRLPRNEYMASALLLPTAGISVETLYSYYHVTLPEHTSQTPGQYPLELVTGIPLPALTATPSAAHNVSLMAITSQGTVAPRQHSSQQSLPVKLQDKAANTEAAHQGMQSSCFGSDTRGMTSSASPMEAIPEETLSVADNVPAAAGKQQPHCISSACCMQVWIIKSTTIPFVLSAWVTS